MATVRMTKYFQAWLKAEYARTKDNHENMFSSYFAWLKNLRSLNLLPEYYARYQESTRRKPEKANANRATHQGTCQCCLRLQALPLGKLSKHGYCVAFRGQGGFFSGTCRGSGEPPFELSCEAMKRFVAEVTEELAMLDRNAKEVIQNGHRFPTQGWFWEENKSGRYDLSRWIYIQFVDGIKGNMGKPFPSWCSANQHSAEDQAKRGNAEYYRQLQSRIKNCRDFITDRLERIENWKLQPLKPIKNENEGAN